MLLEQAISASVSSFVSIPSAYILTAVLAPTGNPQTAPSIIAVLPCLGKLNIPETGRIFPIISVALELTSIAEITIYGNNEGITDRAHVLRASRAYCDARSEKTVSKAQDTKRSRDKNNLTFFFKLSSDCNNVCLISYDLYACVYIIYDGGENERIYQLL